MKSYAIAVAGLGLISTGAHAAETLDAEAVRKLLSGNTALGVGPGGGTQKNFFAADGKTFRQTGEKVVAGTWRVNDDGTQCVEGMPGGCAKIVRNDDGTYDRVVDGVARLKWTTVVKGKDF